MLEKLLQRHKNPFSWITRLVFFVTLCLGVWLHSLWIIILSVVCLATSWFWFPTPKVATKWSEQLVEAELEFLRKSFRGCKAMGVTFVTSLGIIALLVFWYHNLLLGLLLIEIILLFKLTWSLFMMKQAKWLIAGILVAAMIVNGVLLIILA